ncbi:uncharacterized protein [Clytia hemisphaerica]|uniref:uncharacterized protein n=1 Tax=Clytia hemisphaerica TaxID=252671 RepID=UPI0034D6D939
MAEELDIETIFKLKVDGLKEELGKRKLTKSGTKAELQERLLNHITTNDITSITNKDEPVLDDTTEDEELNKEIEESLDKIDTPTALGDEKSKFLSDEAAEPAKEAGTQDKVEEKVEEPVPTPEENITDTESKVDGKKEQTKKIVTVPLTESEKIEQRSKRFGAVVNETEKKKARMDR